MPKTASAIRDPKTILQALVILLISLATTLAAWRWTAQQGETLETIRFHQLADEVVGDVRDRMEAYNQVLLGGVAFLEAAGDVDRDMWRTFVARLEVGRHYPGTQGVGFARRVPREQWRAHEETVHREGFPDYRITPPGERDDAFPIVFLEPFAGRNLRAFGYDMAFEPIRREAMDRARDTGQPVLTGKVVLVQEMDEDVQPGVLLYLPVYGGPAATIEQRRASLRGFVFSPLRMGDLMRGVLDSRLGQLCVEIGDEDAVLFANAGCRPGHYRRDTAIDMFGRRWIVRVQSTPAVDDAIASRHAKLILGSGAVISLLLVWAVISMLVERRLRLALAHAMDEVEAARAEAAGAAAAKTRFMAAASHDLRQPLQSLGLYLHALLTGKGNTGAAGRAALQAYDATTRLVEAMFDAAALETGSARPVVESVAVGELVDCIVAECRAEAEARGLFLRARTCPATVMADKVMLERILRNLIGNALKYTQSGGVLVACRHGPGTVRVKVADSGPGIPADKRELIFEDFYQIENPDRDPRKGLGLGLATVARTARALGFKLYVLSREGKGSTFVVEMPAAVAD